MRGLWWRWTGDMGVSRTWYTWRGLCAHGEDFVPKKETSYG